MKKLFVFSPLALMLIVFFASCEKDPRYMSPQKYLSQAPWKLTFSEAVTTDSSGGSDTVNYFAEMDSCQQDVRYFYASDGQYYSEPGPKKCSGQNLSKKDLGRWQYDAATKVLTIEGNGRLIWDVLALNDSALRLRLTYTLQDSLRNATTTEELHYIHP